MALGVAVTGLVAAAQTPDPQTAINNALPGDEVLLAPGATYSGQFTLPNKGSNTNWIPQESWNFFKQF